MQTKRNRKTREKRGTETVKGFFPYVFSSLHVLMYICIYSGKKEPSTSLFLVYVFYFISGLCMVFFFVPLDYTGRVGLLIQSMELFSHVYVSFHIFSRAKDDYVPFINGRLYLICIGFYLCKILLDDTKCETQFLVLS